MQQIKIQKGSLATHHVQRCEQDWFGEVLDPPLAFSFAIEGDFLVFSASRQAAACVHPEAKLGVFQSELWMYDVAEFFIAEAHGSRYLEFNLSPNGAWWSRVFQDIRVPDPDAAALIELECSSTFSADSWVCSARIPLSYLIDLGLDPRLSRLAVCGILNSPDQLFTSTAQAPVEVPDFHQPQYWPLAHLSPFTTAP